MHLVLIGCEYSGTSTLALAISNWTKEAFGVGGFGFHDHWKIPHLNHPPAETPEESDAAFQAWAEGRGEDPTMMGYDDEEQTLLLALTPKQKEAFQRYHMEYHVSPTFYSYDHHNLVGMHIDEAVYAGLYYGYGGDGEYADRKQYARHVEETMIERRPGHGARSVQGLPRRHTVPHEREPASQRRRAGEGRRYGRGEVRGGVRVVPVREQVHCGHRDAVRRGIAGRVCLQVRALHDRRGPREDAGAERKKERAVGVE